MSSTTIYQQLGNINEQADILRGVLDDCAGLLTGAVPPPNNKARPDVPVAPAGFLPTVVYKNDDIIETLIRARQLAEYIRDSIAGAPAPQSSMERALTGALGASKSSSPRESY